MKKIYNMPAEDRLVYLRQLDRELRGTQVELTSELYGGAELQTTTGALLAVATPWTAALAPVVVIERDGYYPMAYSSARIVSISPALGRMTA